MFVASSSIWTPWTPAQSRLRPWWNVRRRLASMMEVFTTKHLSKNGAGHLTKNASGHLANTCPCTSCPDTITLTISGTTNCSGCIPGPSSTSETVDSGSVNGSFSLTRFSACVWKANVGNAIHTTQYLNKTDCTGSSTGSEPGAAIVLTRNSDGTWTLTIQVGLIYFFRLTNVAAGSCSGGPLSNENTTCDGTVLASGGTASWS